MKKTIFIIGDDEFIKEKIANFSTNGDRLHFANTIEGVEEKIIQCIKGNNPPLLLIKSQHDKKIINWIKMLRKKFSSTLLPKVFVYMNNGKKISKDTNVTFI